MRWLAATLLLLTGCGQTMHFQECGVLNPNCGAGLSCEITRSVINGECVMNAEMHCVKTCTSDSDCRGYRSPQQPLESCRPDCAGALGCGAAR